MGAIIIKIFLHLSKSEQCKRFIDRLEHKEKHWKFTSRDITERRFWIAYQKAYEQAIKKTSPKSAPWYIVPADDKLYAHWLISKIILERLRDLNPVFPAIVAKEKLNIRKEKKKLMHERGRN